MKGKVFFSIVLLILAACASLPSRSGSLDDSVSAYWNARLAEDYAKAFSYEERSRDKNITEKQYMENLIKHGLKVKSFQIGEISYEDENRATVKTEVVYTIPKLGKMEWDNNTPMKNEFPDLWIRKDGKWYHTFTKLGGKPFLTRE